MRPVSFLLAFRAINGVEGLLVSASARITISDWAQQHLEGMGQASACSCCTGKRSGWE